MKILKCPKCNRTQQSGKFCLDDGTLLNEIITSEVKFKPMTKVSRTADQLKADIRKWLQRIGVQNPDIQISTRDNQASVEYKIKQSTYTFSSHLQKSITYNLAAVEQFLHYRVLGIEHGIESAEQAFKGYEALPDYSKGADPFTILGFTEKVDVDVARLKFREYAKKYHPDLNPDKGSQEEFFRIKKAMDDIEVMFK